MNRLPYNPDILRWAREDLNLTLGFVADKFKKTEAEIIAWENGEKSPTYIQLERLAYEIYKLPLATFFLKEVPKVDSINKDFRTIPNDVLAGVSYKTRLALRKGKFLQNVLYELYAVNQSASPIFRMLKIDTSEDPSKVANLISDFLKLEESRGRRFSDFYAYFNHLREKVEDGGVFTFQQQLENDRAFCLYDSEFPIVILNSGDSITGKIFSLIHEIVHVILGNNNITTDYKIYFYTHDSTEVFCNKVASEVILPDGLLFADPIIFQNTNGIWNEDDISLLSRKYGVSREVILRKLVDRGLIPRAEYEPFVLKWNKEERKKRKGGDYYRNQISKFGRNYIESVLMKYRNGLINDSQVGDYISIKPGNINMLETYLYK